MRILQQRTPPLIHVVGVLLLSLRTPSVPLFVAQRHVSRSKSTVSLLYMAKLGSPSGFCLGVVIQSPMSQLDMSVSRNRGPLRCLVSCWFPFTVPRFGWFQRRTKGKTAPFSCWCSVGNEKWNDPEKNHPLRESPGSFHFSFPLSHHQVLRRTHLAMGLNPVSPVNVPIDSR